MVAGSNRGKRVDGDQLQCPEPGLRHVRYSDPAVWDGCVRYSTLVLLLEDEEGGWESRGIDQDTGRVVLFPFGCTIVSQSRHRRAVSSEMELLDKPGQANKVLPGPEMC